MALEVIWRGRSLAAARCSHYHYLEQITILLSHRHQHHQHHHQVAGQPGPDSGYVSHSSGGGYPKLQVDHYDDFHDDEDNFFGT